MEMKYLRLRTPAMLALGSFLLSAAPRGGSIREVLSLDRVRSLSVLALGGGEGHPLFPGTHAEEAAHRMRQPAGGFHQFLGSGPARALQEAEDPGGLAAAAGSFALSNLRLGAALGRCIGWRGL